MLTTWNEYKFVVERGFCPLLDTKNFKMDIRLRVEVQQETFGRGIIATDEANGKFYRWCWEHMPHICEETLKPLKKYSAVYCSHILTRGAYPEIATDPRNINMLCFEAHRRWEVGDRENMRIFQKNLKTIELLKSEYNQL